MNRGRRWAWSSHLAGVLATLGQTRADELRRDAPAERVAPQLGVGLVALLHGNHGQTVHLLQDVAPGTPCEESARYHRHLDQGEGNFEDKSELCSSLKGPRNEYWAGINDFRLESY